MARIAGVDLPNDKRIEVALLYIYGVGPTLATKILAATKIDPDIRTKNLTDDQIQNLAKAVGQFMVEGQLKMQVQSDIARLKDIGSYRGLRHAKSLPVRGQRTRSNARTKRGKRVTIGTVRKEAMARTGVRQPRQ